MLNKVAIIGAGAFGVALAKILANKSNELALWARNEEVVQKINQNHCHPYKLSSALLADNVRATNDIIKALNKAEVVIFSVPMQSFASVLKKANPYLDKNCIIVSTAKGIESEELLLPSQIVSYTLPKELARRVCYLSGPSFASEIALELPTAVTVASLDQQSLKTIQHKFNSRTFRIYVCEDITGVCLGGALKNIIAIAAGITCGFDLGKNALAALITRGLREITRLSIKMGAQAQTLSGLSGMGDLVLSCTDRLSRNHQLGVLLAKGFSLTEALDQIGGVVEGANTAKSIFALVEKYDVEMPICQAVSLVLYQNLSPKNAINDLLEREPKEEKL